MIDLRPALVTALLIIKSFPAWGAEVLPMPNMDEWVACLEERTNALHQADAAMRACKAHEQDWLARALIVMGPEREAQATRAYVAIRETLYRTAEKVVRGR